jgi:hypothetical protein
MKPFKPLTATAIGSVPFLETEATIDLIAHSCSQLPHWPQFVRRSYREDMVFQVVDGLPALELDAVDHRIRVRSDDRETSLTSFYEHFIAADHDYFAIPPEAASGLDAFLEKARLDRSFGPDFLKAQVCGPISFGQSIRTPDDKTLIDDPELADTVVKGLGAKGAWLANKIRQTGREPLIFFDEPGLTGFGSAFSTLDRDQVITMLSETASIVRATGEARIGVHVCGNTDWSILTDADIDVINFDAFGYLDHFLLYPEQIGCFLDKGGYIAWGIVPTLAFTGMETAAGLADKLEQGWRELSRRGLDLDAIRQQALITPSCGVGAINEDSAQSIYELLPKVSDHIASKLS